MRGQTFEIFNWLWKTKSKDLQKGRVPQPFGEDAHQQLRADQVAPTRLLRRRLRNAECSRDQYHHSFGRLRVAHWHLGSQKLENPQAKLEALLCRLLPRKTCSPAHRVPNVRHRCRRARSEAEIQQSRPDTFTQGREWKLDCRFSRGWRSEDF